jgi:hypothetical protein
MKAIDILPGQVHWFTGRRPTPPTMPCQHDCLGSGWLLEVVAWGPDHKHYEMVQCAECSCQAWRSFDGMVGAFYESDTHVDLSGLADSGPG